MEPAPGGGENNMSQRNGLKGGFTVVELLIVIVVIALLAAISILAYNDIQRRAVAASIEADLSSAAKHFELIKAEAGAYPNTVPSNVRPSTGNILQATAVTGDMFCINLYRSDGFIQKSWDSTKVGVQDGLCKGAAVGESSGGDVPSAYRGRNLAPAASQWVLTGSASVDSNILRPGSAAGTTIRSPLIRVDAPSMIHVGGDMYATQPTPSSGINGGYHVNISYFAADGTTPARNTIDYTSNGCGRAFSLNMWHEQLAICSFRGGPEVIYVRVTFYGANNNLASPDLQIRNPLVRVED